MRAIKTPTGKVVLVNEEAAAKKAPAVASNGVTKAAAEATVTAAYAAHKRYKAAGEAMAKAFRIDAKTLPTRPGKATLVSWLMEHYKTAKPAAKKAAPKAPTKPITDTGEKIGGSRKDRSGGRKPKEAPEKDGRPTWQRRYKATPVEVYVARGQNEINWIAIDLRRKQKKGSYAKQRYYDGYARAEWSSFYKSEAEAQADIPRMAAKDAFVVHWAEDPARKTEEGDYRYYSVFHKIKKGKHVYVGAQATDQEFDDYKAAALYIEEHPLELLEGKKAVKKKSGGLGEEFLKAPPKVMRVGKKWRTKDADPNQFLTEFKMRGIEFGNWQGKRQTLVNNAYDAMKDLSQVLDVTPDSLSLGGKLGLAFGARGTGGKRAGRAHYEPSYNVINLTKQGGAGSLAHEWWHAIDHYLAKLDSSYVATGAANSPSQLFGSHRVINSEYSQDLSANVHKAYRDLMKAMAEKTVTKTVDPADHDKTVAYHHSTIERALEAVRENLKQGTSGTRMNKPVSATKLAEFDRYAHNIAQGEDFVTNLEGISKIYKAVRGVNGLGTKKKLGILGAIVVSQARKERAIRARESAKANPVVVSMDSTDYLRGAAKLDATRSKPYWTTYHELAARAFSSYVEDKLAAKKQKSDYLSWGAANADNKYGYGDYKPFPEGDERTQLNEKFDKLLDAMREAKILHKPATKTKKVITKTKKAK